MIEKNVDPLDYYMDEIFQTTSNINGLFKKLKLPFNECLDMIYESIELEDEPSYRTYLEIYLFYMISLVFISEYYEEYETTGKIYKTVINNFEKIYRKARKKFKFVDNTKNQIEYLKSRIQESREEYFILYENWE